MKEFDVVLGAAFEFKLADRSVDLWNMSAGLKRELVKLLVQAYRMARHGGATMTSWAHLIRHEPQPGSGYELVDPYAGSCQKQGASHADEPNPVSTWCVDAGVLRPLRQRRPVRRGAQSDALAG